MFMLILMGMVLVCLAADDYVDSQQLVKQVAGSESMAAVAVDFDLDDDDEAVGEVFVENNGWTLFPVHETNGLKTNGSRCPKALLLGQIRRCSPRSSLPNNHNLFEKHEKWYGCVLCHFFVLVCNVKSLINNIL